MDLKLSEDERLIRETAAQFVDKELIAREGEYLRQPAPFLPPGAPPRREIQPERLRRLNGGARHVGLSRLLLHERLCCNDQT